MPLSICGLLTRVQLVIIITSSLCTVVFVIKVYEGKAALSGACELSYRDIRASNGDEYV